MDNNLDNNQGGRRPDKGDPRRNQDPNRNKKNHQSILAFLICLLVTLVCFSLFTNMLQDNSSEITYDKFIDMVNNDEVKSVTLQSDTLTIVPKKQVSPYQEISYYTNLTEDETALTKRLEGTGIIFKSEPPDAFGEFMAMMLSVLLPSVLLFVLLMFFMRRMNKGGGGVMGVGKSRAKAYVQKETGITFKDVAGQDEAKESLQEVVEFLHNPGKYVEIGAKLPKGALLVGPPGTGKTLLAKAVAGEAHVPFFSLSGSEFVEMFVGVGASRVRDLFEEAKKNAPCIVFIDEIDAIGKSRDSHYGGGNDEREQTLNQLLAEMDGFESNKGLVLLAATNRPEILDPALLRPGRFDRRIIVEKPDLKGRVEVLKVHSKDVKMDETVNLEEIALATSGAVGSDLANMINEAAINAVKHGRNAVCQSDLFEAVEVVLVGKEKKDRIDDALHATRAAVKEGVVAGGGVALLYSHKALESLSPANQDQRVGIDIIRKAIQAPIRQIAENAGVDGAVVAGKLMESTDTNFGYNAQSGEYTDMIKAGIVDPTEVVRTALQDAASVAGLLITTESMVTEAPQKECHCGCGGAGAGAGGMPGGMGF